MAKKDYSQLSQEELIEEIKQLKERKKYGLVWEDKAEDVAVQCQNELPVLEEVYKRAIIKDPHGPTNILIEGDNYHALSVLNYTHAGKIDVIYADPPYNTGARDWKYNNNFVDATDSFRHSKWLSFMQKRLKLAKNLLSDNGIICVTVDDYEAPRLTLLMEEIFGETNHLGTVVIRSNPSGRSTEKGFSIAHEYALFFARTAKAKIGRLARNEIQKARYQERDSQGQFEWVNFRKHGATREESPKMYFPIYLTRQTIRIPRMEWKDEKQDWIILDKPKKDEVVIYPIDENGFERRWKWGLERSRNEIQEMKIDLDRNGKLAIYIKSHMSDGGTLPLTWWDKKEYSATAYGTNLLKGIFSKLQAFSYPKSLYAVMDCVRVCSTSKDAVILDFFAGSGTTGHAVMQLNQEDGGKRKFILATNNENKIAEEVCYPRIKKVIEGNGGIPEITGFSANVRYFKTAFVSKNKVSDDVKYKLVERSTEMIRIREDTYDEVVDKKYIKIFKNADHYTAILFHLDYFSEFKKKLHKLDKETHIYVFSLTTDTYDEDFRDLKQKYALCPIPESILQVYKRVFRE